MRRHRVRSTECRSVVRGYHIPKRFEKRNIESRFNKLAMMAY
jgi:hypothetical protein